MLLLFPLAAGSAEILLLFDGSQSNRPQDQPWMTYVDNPFLSPAPAQTVVGGTGVRLDTRGNFDHSEGYFNHDLFLGSFTGLHNPDFPALNPADGFSLTFDLLIHDKDHLSSNRAGFSVILLGMDLYGIELGFWENQIWAQGGTGFTQAEGFGHDTDLSLSTYELLILESKYFLLADGVEILTGPIRDYSPASPFPDPYDEQNMLFLGDNTTSTSADFTLGRITPTTGLVAAAPAPLPAWLMPAGAGWLARARPRL